MYLYVYICMCTHIVTELKMNISETRAADEHIRSLVSSRALVGSHSPLMFVDQALQQVDNHGTAGTIVVSTSIAATSMADQVSGG